MTAPWPKLTPNIVEKSLILFLGLLLLPVWSLDLLRGLALLFGLLLFSAHNRDVFVNSLDSFLRKFPQRWQLTYALILAAHTLSYWIFNAMAGHTPLWDEGQYVQGVYNLASSGTSWISFRPGYDIPYSAIHRSLSVEALAFLFKIFRSTIVVQIWQGFFAVLPAFGFWWLAKLGQPEESKNPTSLGFMSFLLYFFSYNFINQINWPYTFHILGPSLLIFALVGYLRKMPLLWMLALSLLPFEKEDFALISFGFVALALIDVSRKRLPVRFLPAGIAVFCFAIQGVLFQTHNQGWANFEASFGSLGKTPKDAVLFLLSQPGSLLIQWSRPNCLIYWISFLGFGALFFKPSWSAARYLIIALPMMIVNTLSDSAAFQNVGGHYSVLVNIISCFSFLAWALSKTPAIRNSFIFGMITLSVTISNDTLAHISGSAFLDYLHRDQSQLQALAPIRSEVSTLCCSQSICGHLATRRRGYFSFDCFSKEHFKNPLESDDPVRFVLTPQDPLVDKIRSCTSVETETAEYKIFSLIPASQVRSRCQF